MPRTLSACDMDAVFTGRPLIADERVFAFDAANRLIAILEPRANRWKPRKVFVSGS